MPERWVRVARASDVPPGQSLTIKVGEEEGLLHNVDGSLYCTGSISRGSSSPVRGTHGCST